MSKREEIKEQLYEVQVYRGNDLVTTLTLSAESPEQASNKAFNDFHVKVKRAYN